MLKQFFSKLFGKPQIGKPQNAESKTVKSNGGKHILAAAQHQISPKSFSQAALKTCDGLQRAGFDAYIVGGAVRDLLLGFSPKDFDIATNATPEQVQRVFKRSRIIGRRFRIVHVLWGSETIEVTTFRGHHQAENNEQESAKTESGRLVRDNVYGSLEEDAARRDFTANALYYDPKTQQMLDFLGGVADIRAGVLRMIGDAKTRYQEDPVRMLRAVRLSAKLGLSIAPETQAPIRVSVDLLQEVSPSRLFDEMLKLFLSGHAVESVNALRAQQLHHGLLPLLDVVLEQPLGEKFVMLALNNTDQRINAGKSSNPSFLFAALLWHEVLVAWKKHQAQGEHLMPALYNAMSQVIDLQAEKLAIHNRYQATMREIWSMQPRFEQRSGKRPFGLLTHPRYRAGYDFLLLRCASGELDTEIGDWWTTFADANTETRNAMLLTDSAPKKRRRRKRKAKPDAGEGAA